MQITQRELQLGIARARFDVVHMQYDLRGPSAAALALAATAHERAIAQLFPRTRLVKVPGCGAALIPRCVARSAQKHPDQVKEHNTPTPGLIGKHQCGLAFPQRRPSADMCAKSIPS